jgi:ABC-2 type transport system permease protein
MVIAVGALAAALAVALTVALFRTIGPKRTRLAAQIVAAIVGATFVIGLQIAAILSYGTLSYFTFLKSDLLVSLVPAIGSAVWWPARAVLGDMAALAAVLSGSLLVLAAATALFSARFGDHAIAAAGVSDSGVIQRRWRRGFRRVSPRATLRRKEWTLLRRDPWLASQTLMQMLYLLPPAILLWRTFEAGGGALNLLVPVLVMAAGHLAGGLAWLSISGEDAPDLVATAPIPQRYVLRAKIEAVIAIIAVIFAPLVAVIAIALPWHAAITGAGIVIAAACATAIQLWFRTQAERSQFRRRQVSSRVATFAEAFSSIGWAATAAVAAVSLWLAIPPA